MLGAQGWITFLRIVVGAWFLKAVWTKLTVEFAWGVVPYITVSSRFIGFHPKRVAEFAVQGLPREHHSPERRSLREAPDVR
jgi:uncharacterized membrane protein YphA (DoxX/SURF4 family)